MNAGPLAYAHAFLDKSVLASHPHKHIEMLQQVYREFIGCCGKALEQNDQLIKEDQRMYQEDMKEKYAQLRTQLAKYIGDEVCWFLSWVVIFSFWNFPFGFDCTTAPLEALETLSGERPL